VTKLPVLSILLAPVRPLLTLLGLPVVF
jgi:hypothetical protein